MCIKKYHSTSAMNFFCAGLSLTIAPRIARIAYAANRPSTHKYMPIAQGRPMNNLAIHCRCGRLTCSLLCSSAKHKLPAETPKPC